MLFFYNKTEALWHIFQVFLKFHGCYSDLLAQSKSKKIIITS